MFGVGNVLATTVRLWLRNLPRFVLLALLFYIPLIAWTIALEFESSRELLSEHYYEPLFEVHPLLSGWLAGGRWILDALLTAAIAVYVVSRMRGEPVTARSSTAVALRRSPRVFGAALIAHLGTTGIMTVVGILLWDREGWFYRTEVGYYGWLAAWVILVSLWVAVVPVAAVEKRGVFASIGRNFALGHRMKIFALVLLLEALIFAMYWLSFELLLADTYFQNYREWRRIYNFVTLGFEVLFATFGATLAGVIYERLRAAKDGPSEGELHRVFE